MPYRRTENVVRRLAAREQPIVDAARAAAAEGGMAAVQIAPVAERAGIAAGTVYRYFPSKTDLVAALVGAVAEREIAAMRDAADAAPGPLSALAAAHRDLRRARAARAPARLGGDRRAGRQRDRRAAARISQGARRRDRDAARGGDDAGHLPEQDVAVAAPAVVGALLEGLIGPLAPEPAAIQIKTPRSGAER